ncbi:MFS transporter [Rubrobacter marinus]|uniref:MFS transporter n=1 Tax=Rubrobacter marinus TaxID=2653852 RepID=UPI00140A6B6D
MAGAVAADLASPEKQGRALSLVIGGMTVAWVVGIPLGTLVGDEFGWRASFVMVGALAAVAAVAVAAVLPDVENPPVAGLRSMFTLAGRAAILAVLGITALGVAAGFVVLTYIRPLLEDLTGYGGGGIGALLLVFGLASIAGNSLGGYWADRRGYRGSMGGILVVLALSLLSFSLLTGADAGSTAAVLGAVAALVAWSVAGFAIIPLQQYRLIRTAPESRNTVLSLNASAIYLGQGAGSILGSFALGYGSIAALGWVGALCAGVALILLLTGIRRAKGEPAPERAAA